MAMFSNSLTLNFSVGNLNDTNTDTFDLRASGPQINITTPENITYTEPMSGYYPGTYGFENDIVGSDAFEWIDGSIGSCNAEIVSNHDGHEKVVKLDDTYTATANDAEIRQNFTAGSQNSGTIEFWFNKDWGDGPLYLLLEDSLSSAVINFRFDYGNNGKFQAGGGGWHDFPISGGYSDSTWIHNRLELNCSTDTYDYYIDGELKYDDGLFHFDANNITEFILRTGYTGYEAIIYLDAIGYSWDPYYNIGDNYYEGLYLNFEESITTDWIGYSLDGKSNRTISGNTTISMPENGLRSIQVHANNSIGEMYESDIRYFTIDYHPIEIISPENKIYTEPMSGYYPGTYSFEDETGQVGYGISFMDYYTAASGCYADVLSNLGGHNEVLHLRDGSSGGSVWFENFCDSEQSYGSIEFWIRTTDASLGTTLKLFDNSFSAGGNQAGEFKYGSDAFNVLNGSSWVALTAPIPQDNVWYHIRVHFESSAGGYMGLSQYTYSIEIDGDNVGSFDYFYTPMNIKVIHFATGYTNANFDSYIDAIGYSWEPNYKIGDNMYEGLLLSHYTELDLEWIGYSLDTYTNITILGNTTIPFLDEGVHSVQVFGNDSFGRMFQSEVQYFTTAYNPEVNITTPNYHEYFGNSAPSFVISINEPNLHSTWYNLNNGVNITFSGLSGIINQTEWDKLANGSVTMEFYANDTWGLEGYAEVTVRKDTYTPTSSILFFPHSGIDVVNETTEFSLTASDNQFGSGVSFIRYRINDSSWVTYSTPFTLASYPYGDILISYQAVDQVDNYETIQTLLLHRTDTIAPTSSIAFTPYQDPNIIIRSTTFTITGDDGLGSGISLIRYKIDNSAWFDYLGPFSLSSYQDGDHTITYQAIDVVGNIEVEHGVMITLVSEPTPPGIPGYHLIVIISIISIVSAIIIKKKFKFKL